MCFVMMRISMSLPKKLLSDFDEVLKERGYQSRSNTSMHIHMTDKYCMEIVVVNGDIAEIRDLTERIMRLKGVEHVKLTSTANGEEFSEPGHSHEHGHHHH